MSYNPYRWFTKGSPIKPLRSDAPLLLRIRNKEFDYCYMFAEADEMDELAKKIYEKTANKYRGNDESARHEMAREESRMKRIKAIKLRLEADMWEWRVLNRLQIELSKEFGKDLWDKAMEQKKGLETVEDLYYWYKKQTKTKQTRSEFDIRYRRANTKGAEHLF
jgi:hypothetical protein